MGEHWLTLRLRKDKRSSDLQIEAVLCLEVTHGITLPYGYKKSQNALSDIFL